MALDITRFIERFVEEAQDQLPRLREGVTALEHGGHRPQAINALFRAVHTLKGSSRMLRLEAISTLTHAMEELLGALRDGLREPDPATLGLLNQAADLLDTQVNRLAEGHPPQTLPQADPALYRALTMAPDAIQIPDSALQRDSSAAAAPSDQATPSVASGSPPPRLRLSDSVRVRRERLDDLIHLMGEVLSGHHHLHDLVDQARGLGAALPEGHQPALRAFHREFKDSVQSQDASMSELHDRALQLRMLPLAVVFDPLAQMTRDLAQGLDKKAVCRLQGSDIELDRQMIDHLSEPLLHLLRNALDHGLESPEARRLAGKNAQGRITLEARQDGNGVVIELGDDGAGIDIDAVREQALARRLVSEEELALLSEQEIVELIFAPGFSTRPTITETSGRGVGMDAVKRTVVDELSGDIRLAHRPGEGCTVTLHLPLSLAMMRVLLVRAGQHTFGVTAPYVATLLEVWRKELTDTAGQRTLILGDASIPVAALATLLGLEAAPENDRLLLLIAQQGTQKLALIVDEIIDERDMVIKPLPEHLGDLPLVAGMVSTGRNALVSLLHVPSLLTQVKLHPERDSTGEPDGHFSPRILIVDDSLHTREIEKDVLEAWGYRVTLAENGQQGLDKALANAFDAILTDIEMPVMDGFTLIARLRRNERYRQVPIIIITSREQEMDRKRGMAAGANAYIIKGDFDQNHLVDTLKTLLD
ncbi:hybrid sensor histidine kinase/response regulator [Vreelandella sp. EE7]